MFTKCNYHTFIGVFVEVDLSVSEGGLSVVIVKGVECEVDLIVIEGG